MSEESIALRTHLPCPDCGSRDALTEYSDGHTFCFSCEKPRNADGTEDLSAGIKTISKDFLRVAYQALSSRRLTEETCRFWSYGVADFHGNQTQVAQYLNDNRELVAQKMRTRDKEFPWIHPEAAKGLYGQWLWRDGGKQVVITEGELDALSVSQVQNNKWPVVSLPNGAGKKAVKAVREALPWLNKFEKVILFLDNDDPGRETAKLLRSVIAPGKCYITYAPEGFKDASDLLQAGKGSVIIDCIWGAKQYRPENLVSGADVVKRLMERPKVASFPYPDILPMLNYMTGGGIRLGELDVWTSGTGMGKTTLIKALQYHYLTNTFNDQPLNQAIIHLEEPLEDTGDDLIQYAVGSRFTVDDQDFRGSPEFERVARELFESVDAEGNPRLQLYDAFGSLEGDTLFEIIRYAATALGVKVFWIDHLSILVSDLDSNDDERRRIDRIMHGLKELTVELGVYIGLISHLRKPQGSGKSFEEGTKPTLDDLRGSGGIKQLANAVFALSRDQQADDPVEKNTSLVSVLKCRKTGRTGDADYVLFNESTGRLEKGREPEFAAGFNDESRSSAY